MRIGSLVPVLFLSFAAATFSAQRQGFTINPATPEGRLLQQVGQESDDTKKIALMEEFLAQYPNHEATIWVYDQMVASCTKAGQFDKALSAAGKVLAADPTDVETAYAAVKAAEAKKDPDAVRKWAVEASDLARKAAQKPKGGEEDEDAYKQRVDSAKRVDTYTEYALFATAVQTPDPAKKVELLKTLESRAPESTYVTQGRGLYFQSLIQSGDMPGAVGMAEKLIAINQANEEMLATAGDFYLRQNREPDKVLDYSTKLVAAVNARAKPDAASEADWQKYRVHYLGLGDWMAGVTYCVQAKYGDCNKTLREALPMVEDKIDYKAAALFNLGIANSHLRNVPDAGKFFEQCAALESPYRPKCAENLKAIRSTYRVIK